MRRLAAALAATACAVATGSGCADQQEALIVLHSVNATEDDAGCTWEAEGAPLRSGRLDVSAGHPYVLAPVLINNLPPRSADSTNSSVDDSELQLTDSVDVSLHLPQDVVDRMGDGPDGEPLPLSFPSYIATDSLPAGSRYVPRVEVLTADHSVALAQAVDWGDTVQLSVELVFHATRTGNSRGEAGVIDAREYSFPIELCNGCLVVGCQCDAADECVSGTLQHVGTCGRAQDLFGSSEAFDCSLVPDAAATTGGTDEGSTGAPPDGASSSGGSSSGG